MKCLPLLITTLLVPAYFGNFIISVRSIGFAEAIKYPKMVIIMTSSESDKWIPGEPMQVTMDTDYDAEDKVLNITVTLVFRHGGFKVDWGSAVLEDNFVYISTQVFEYTGPAIQAITIKLHTYKITNVEPGTYTIELYINGKPYSHIVVPIGATEEPVNNHRRRNLSFIVSLTSAVLLVLLIALLAYASKSKGEIFSIIPQS
ncbi:MAG: hypothetical protein J7J99_08260 [Thermoprotei archaeon]|nr:hypothetical protein [Thermoprotei archaeon]